MRLFALLGATLLVALAVEPAKAGYDVSATYTSALDANGVDFDYTITLTNAATSTSTVGTFWFAWVPGKDFMSNNPISEINPAGWTSKVTHGGATDGYAIQWVAGSTAADLLPGSSLTFEFTSAETPAQLAGFSADYPASREATYFVYSGAPFSDAGFQSLATPAAAVPEPSSLILTAAAVGLAFAGRAWASRKNRR